ncbi:hypothetical protein E1287_27250 [Actinomadura sp. KC06]|uniref:hypothetical protein n=1 Tax=Actinomadura sp. KC06 TaxID=2530369 RepID=UPI00104CCBD1|nr:hypothetical protein [Actinomadura sp. KC06]TDD31215.1 hypothetical protein E1287_27250 [Actinomadura sp. KC06]
MRKVSAKTSEDQLDRIVSGRNLIAHTGDRRGRGRANIPITEVEADLAIIVEIIDALDRLTAE